MNQLTGAALGDELLAAQIEPELAHLGEEQLHQLRLLGCDEMQGYLFGRPVPVETFEQKYMSSTVC